MKTEIDSEESLKKGKMVKSPFKMDDTEYKEWQVKAQKNAEEHLFSIGQPLVYKKGGRYIAEFANGSVKDLD